MPVTLPYACRRIEIGGMAADQGQPVTFNMIKVKSGMNKMGATPEQGRATEGDEQPVHWVTISKDFYIGDRGDTGTLEYVMNSNPSVIKDPQPR